MNLPKNFGTFVAINLSPSHFQAISSFLFFFSSSTLFCKIQVSLDKRTHTTMSSIAPLNISQVELEAGLPVSKDAPDKEPVKSVAPAPKTGGNRNYVLLGVIIVVMGGLGLALGMTQSGSSPAAAPVESATTSDTNTITDTNTNTNTDPALDDTMDWFPDDSYSVPTIDDTTEPTIETSDDYLPPAVVEVFEDMCHEAESVPTDGTHMIGNAGHRLRKDLPICHKERILADGSWYTVTADSTGEFTAEFQAWYAHYDNVNFVSVYEGDCDKELTCVEGIYSFGNPIGRYKWNAVEGVEYKVVVHSTGPFALNIFAPGDRGCLMAETIVVDGDNYMGQASAPISKNIPVCQQEHGEGGGSWYTVTADEDGILMGLFAASYQHSGVDDFLSVYEGSCGEFTCVDGTYEFDGTYGFYTWDAVAGTEYKVLVHSVGAFGLRIVSMSL
jgi:hypothetical protein